jgi:hypothetical protein
MVSLCWIEDSLWDIPGMMNRIVLWVVLPIKKLGGTTGQGGENLADTGDFLQFGDDLVFVLCKCDHVHIGTGVNCVAYG